MPPSNDAKYFNDATLKAALRQLFGTADHLLKIWLTLKQMGMAEGAPAVLITTSSPNEALLRLFSFGSAEGELFVPFAHTPRFMTMKSDAGRSIIQTNIQRWKSSGSVVTCDPTGFLDIQTAGNDALLVGPTRGYPLGLGFGKNGFALSDEKRVSIPSLSFAVWYYRQTPLFWNATTESLDTYLLRNLRLDLKLSMAEFDAIFVADKLELHLTDRCLSDQSLFSICNAFMSSPPKEVVTAILPENFAHHSLRVRSMKTTNLRPAWLNKAPSSLLKEALALGERAVVLYGPPRTGKTRAIDLLHGRASEDRITIQIHDGWGYDNLVEGFRPNSENEWKWEAGALKLAIENKKKIIVLEEINRTNLTQALGEVFSLIEPAYRGAENRVTLRSGATFFIPTDVTFLMTMNTLDRSTEDIDDALMGRFAAIEFPPRVEDLGEILTANQVDQNTTAKLQELFALIQEFYPLGQGYFSGFKAATNPLLFYTIRLRPVLLNHFRDFKPESLELIDTKVDDLFGH